MVVAIFLSAGHVAQVSRLKLQFRFDWESYQAMHSLYARAEALDVKTYAESPHRQTMQRPREAFKSRTSLAGAAPAVKISVIAKVQEPQ